MRTRLERAFGLGDERVGDLAADGLEFEHAGKHGRQLVEPVKLVQLESHPLVQQAVLDGEGDAIGDGAQLRGLRRLEGLIAAPGEQQQTE